MPGGAVINLRLAPPMSHEFVSRLSTYAFIMSVENHAHSADTHLEEEGKTEKEERKEKKRKKEKKKKGKKKKKRKNSL